MTASGQPLDVNEIMALIQAEAARRYPLGQTSAADIFPAKRKYALEEFLRLEGDAFVEAVHRGLLRQDAEPERCKIYVQALEAGRMTKADLLLAVRWSKEGRQHAVKVAGLGRLRRTRVFERLPLLGRVLAWLDRSGQRRR
ncbi:hypothetical protein ACFW16_31240 [Inquilinus sp. NPDC058860]|uniref:hypothetical protein n=1 Tax=Inquilinus sp. NPDC058860 TaxID=3346652 RepID=UPI0036AC99B8